MRLLIAGWVLALPLAAAEPAVPPPAPPELARAPWYDAERGTWRRVVPRREPGAVVTGGGTTPVFAYAMYAVVATALTLLALQVWRLRGRDGPAAAASPRPAVRATVAALPFALPTAAEDPARALDRALAAGDLASATAWLYALQLFALDGAGVIRLATGKTNRAYLEEARRQPACASVLARTIAAFERSWFGHQPPSRAAFDVLHAEHRALLASLPAGAA